MSNLKRAFSMVMALVMVLGMITIPAATAAEASVSESIFSDASEITYGEAVAITGGIGLFAGTDGKFLPKGTVTRAQMATIIVKMLHGADANADSFKGEGKFIDTAYFEGGWAEGYINWCATLGIVAGYGDGTFKPGNEVTTAEAATMILNALKIDAGEGTWPTTVMSKATEEGMFKDLKSMPGTNKALNREQLAVVALNGLNWSASDDAGWYVSGGAADEDMTFETFKEAKKYADAVGGKAQELKGRDSLGRKVYGLKSLEGWITANQSSLVDGNYTELTWFDGAEAKTERFALVTDESMLGHKVELWYEEVYTSDRKPGKAFAAVEQAEYITLLRDAMKAEEYKTAFDTKKVSSSGLTLAVDSKGYVKTGVAATAVLNNDQAISFIAGQQAPAGTYVVDNETHLICGYIAPAALTMAKVSYVDTTEGNESISVGTLSLPNSAEDDRVNEYEGIAKDDYVTYTQVQEKYTLTKMETVTGAITEYYTRTDGKQVLTINGEQYITGVAAGSIAGMTSIADLADNFVYEQEYVFYLAPDSSVLGYETVAGGGFDLANTFFVLGVIETTSENAYGVQTKACYARGIDMTGNEAMIPVGAEHKNAGFVGADSIEDFSTAKITATTNNFYSVEDLTTSKEAKELGLKKLVPFPTKYDKNDPNSTTYTQVADGVGYSTSEWGPGGQFEYGVAEKVSGGKTINGTWLSTYKGTKYIVLEGTVDQTEPLSVTVKTADEADFYAAGAVNNRILRSRRASGGDELEVMVLMTSMDRITKNSLIYVAAGKNNAVGVDALGNTFSVYDALTGAEMTITLEGISTIPAGFYSLGYDSEEGLHKIALANGVPVMLPGKTNESEFEQLNDVKDGRKFENVAYDAQLIGFNGSNITTDVTNYNSASGIKVIDPRTDDEVTKSGVARITSMDQLWGMVEAMEGRVRFELDLCFNNSKVVTAFVEVYNNSSYGGQGSNTVVYYSGDGDKVTVITSDMYPLYHEIEVDADVLDDLSEGTYSFGFGANNVITMETAVVPGTTRYAATLPETSREPLNTITTVCDDPSSSDLIEYVYVAAEDLVVITDATTGAPSSDVTEIAGEVSAVEFDKVYDTTGVLGGLTTDNFAAKAEQYEITYSIYNTVTGKKLLVVEDAVALVKNGTLPASYTIVGGADELPSGMSLADVLADASYDVNYILYDGNRVYILECTHFTDLAAGELAALDDNLRLTKDTVLTGPIEVKSNKVLDLNGYNLYALSADAAPYFTISNDAKLTIKDSSMGDGKITGVDGASQAMIKVEKGALVLEGGTLTGHTSSSDGGAVNLGDSTTFTMTGGAISGNATSAYGGAVYVGKNATFTMNGGEISENAAKRGGGITNGDVAGSSANIVIGGNAVIADNSCVERGANLYSYDANVTFGGNAKIGGSSGGNTASAADNTQLRGGTMAFSGGTVERMNFTNGSAGVAGTISGNAVIEYAEVGTVDITVQNLVTGASITVNTKGVLKTDQTVNVNDKSYSYVGDSN